MTVSDFSWCDMVINNYTFQRWRSSIRAVRGRGLQCTRLSCDKVQLQCGFQKLREWDFRGDSVRLVSPCWGRGEDPEGWWLWVGNTTLIHRIFRQNVPVWLVEDCLSIGLTQLNTDFSTIPYTKPCMQSLCCAAWFGTVTRLGFQQTECRCYMSYVELVGMIVVYYFKYMPIITLSMYVICMSFEYYVGTDVVCVNVPTSLMSHLYVQTLTS